MKFSVIVLVIALSGCTVIQDAGHEFKKEMYGFQEDFNRSILRKDPDFNVIMNGVPDDKRSVSKLAAK